jgi:hypothetical protein
MVERFETMDREAIYGVGLVLGVLAVLCVYVWWWYARSDSLLRRWAEENGFQILDYKLRLLSTGPFSWTSINGQTVYQVHVRDVEGRERSGWLRCGSFWSGVLDDRSDVRWDSEQA